MSGETANSSSYTTLSPIKVVKAALKLKQRIYERFPESGLYETSDSIYRLTADAVRRTREISKPNYWLRAIAITLSAIMLGATTLLLLSAPVSLEHASFIEIVQFVEAGINDLIFVAIALFFAISLEMRFKRRKALKAIHELRSLAHVIDMLQFTKNPDKLLKKGAPTASSPKEEFTAFELSRYLDYCSELLGILGKIGALYAQELEDGVVLASVNEVEDLTTGLSRKIWQKLMMLSQLPIQES